MMALHMFTWRLPALVIMNGVMPTMLSLVFLDHFSNFFGLFLAALQYNITTCISVILYKIQHACVCECAMCECVVYVRMRVTCTKKIYLKKTLTDWSIAFASFSSFFSRLTSLSTYIYVHANIMQHQYTRLPFF